MLEITKGEEQKNLHERSAFARGETQWREDYDRWLKGDYGDIPFEIGRDIDPKTLSSTDKTIFDIFGKDKTPNGRQSVSRKDVQPKPPILEKPQQMLLEGKPILQGSPEPLKGNSGLWDNLKGANTKFNAGVEAAQAGNKGRLAMQATRATSIGLHAAGPGLDAAALTAQAAFAAEALNEDQYKVFAQQSGMAGVADQDRVHTIDRVWNALYENSPMHKTGLDQSYLLGSGQASTMFKEALSPLW